MFRHAFVIIFFLVIERFTSNLDKYLLSNWQVLIKIITLVKMSQGIHVDKISSIYINVERHGNTWNLESCSVVNFVVKVEMLTAWLRSCNF